MDIAVKHSQRLDVRRGELHGTTLLLRKALVRLLEVLSHLRQHLNLVSRRLQRELRVLRGHSEWINALAFAPNSNQLLSVSGGVSAGEVILWDADSGEQLRAFDGHTAAVRGVEVENTGGDPLVGLRYFGPDAFATVPHVGDATAA